MNKNLKDIKDKANLKFKLISCIKVSRRFTMPYSLFKDIKDKVHVSNQNLM